MPLFPSVITAAGRSPGLTSVLAGLATLGALGASPSFVMATDSCEARQCDESNLTWAYVVISGGVAFGRIVAVGG